MGNKAKVSPQVVSKEGSKSSALRGAGNVRINLPDQMVVGSHVKVVLYNSNRESISPRDFTIKFVGDPGGCEISIASETTKRGKELSILLIAGSVPGDRMLQINLKRGPARSIRFPFKVIGHSSNAEEGVGICVNGVDPVHRPKIPMSTDISPQSDSYPGGGATPQVFNFGIIRLGWDYAGYCHPFYSEKDWAALFGGVGETNSGGRNVRTYYEEMQDSFTIRCQDIGTYSMRENWNDCFWLGASYHWFPNGGLLEKIFEMARDDIEALGTEFVQSLHGLFIVVMPSPHNQVVWPCCFGPKNVNVSLGRGSEEISKYIYGIFVSEDIDEPGTATYVPDYDLVERTAHEIGHTLGMQDLRMTTSPGGGSAPLNPVNDWDLMCDEKLLPQMALANRVYHSLIPDSRLYGHSIYNPKETVVQTTGQGLTHPVARFRGKRGLIFKQEGETQISQADLEPLETVLNVSPNGLEMVITEGWSLYFEFRKKQSDQISDQYIERIAHVQSGADHALIGMQSKLWGRFAPYRQVEMLPYFHNGLPFFTSINLSESYDDIVVKTLEASPLGDILCERRLGVSVKFESVENGCAKVTIRAIRPPEERPDPCIRPWRGYDEWVSPDIEVKNDRQEVGIAPGVKNTIKVTVRNAGNVEASRIIIDLYAMDMGLGNPWNIWDTRPIGTMRIPSLAPDSSQDISFDYYPPVKENFSDDEENGEIISEMVIGARIRELSREITRENNFAQSRFIALSSNAEEQGYSCEATKFYVTNPYDRPVQVFLTIRQTNPNFRTFLDKSWIKLGPNETRSIVGRFQYKPQERSVQRVGEVNWVTINSFIRDTSDSDGHLKPLSGVNIKVSKAVSTSIELKVDGTRVKGKVKDYNGNLLDSGKVVFWVNKGYRIPLVNMRFTVDVRKEGGKNIVTTLPRGWHTVKAYFIPPAGYSRCESPLIQSTE